MEIPVTIRSSKELYGIYHYCDNSQIAVILLHGLYGSRVDSHRLCVNFARAAFNHNISCLRVDLTGSGISQGSFIDFTFDQQLRDVKNIIYWLNKQTNVKIIFLLGLSDGAITAYHAGINNEDINGVIFWSPFFSSETRKNKTSVLSRMYKVGNSWAWPFLGNWLYKSYFKDKQNLIDLVDFKFMNKECLAIYGTNDIIVRECIEKIDSARLKKYAIKGGDHIFLSPQWSDQVIEKTIKWIDDYQARYSK